MKTCVPPASIDAPEPIVLPDEPGFTARNTPAPMRFEGQARDSTLCLAPRQAGEVAFFTSNPIHFQAPWFAARARRDGHDMKVFHFHEPAAAAQGADFGRLLNWNVSHRVSYENAVLSPEATGEARSPGDIKRARAALADLRLDVALGAPRIARICMRVLIQAWIVR